MKFISQVQNRLLQVGLWGCVMLFPWSCQNPQAANETEVKALLPLMEDSVSRMEANSLFGKPLLRTDWAGEDSVKLMGRIQDAAEKLQSDSSEYHFIWLGRRLAYAMRYQEAIEVYQSGLKKYPDSYELRRHLAHRYLSTRAFAKAEEVFKDAAQLAEGKPIAIEEDGIPNRLNTPLSNTHFNIWYHLALAQYLQGKYADAEKSYAKCMLYSDNNDLKVATTDWWYLTLKQLGEDQKADSLLAGITKDMEVIENDTYLQRLLMYKGERSPQELAPREGDRDVVLTLATQGYGIASYYLFRGDTTQAISYLNQVIETGNWAAFGYIASEADLLRLSAK